MASENVEIERLLLNGLKSGNAKSGVKALFKKLHARVDELEAERKRVGKTARSKTGRRPRGERAR